MDTFIDSSWYWYRYLSPEKADAPVDRALVERWTPVDQYTGGAEHAVMHLLYSRFFTKVMRDVGLIDQSEPFRRLFNQGQILGIDGERMSKSRGNIVDPDDLVARYGADTVRLFLMFMGPWDQGGPWSPTGIGGVHRFLNRVWTIALDPNGPRAGRPGRAARCRRARTRPTRATAIRAAAHRTLRDVTDDYEAFHFNTMVAKLMELTNVLMRYRGTAVAGSPEWDEAVRLLLLMLAPAAPHITEELWSRRLAAAGEPWSSIHAERWPDVDPAADRRGDARGPGPGQRQGPRPGHRGRGHRRGRARALPSLASARVQALLAGREPLRIIHRRRRPARQHRRRRCRIARPRPPIHGSRPTSIACWPSIARVGRHRAGLARHDPRASSRTPWSRSTSANKLIAFGRSMKMRGLLFAIIAHKAHVNLQLADGADLPDPAASSRAPASGSATSRSGRWQAAASPPLVARDHPRPARRPTRRLSPLPAVRWRRRGLVGRGPDRSVLDRPRR